MRGVPSDGVEVAILIASIFQCRSGEHPPPPLPAAVVFAPWCAFGRPRAALEVRRSILPARAQRSGAFPPRR